MQQSLSVILDSPAIYPVVVEPAIELVRAVGATLRIVVYVAERDASKPFA